MNSVNDILHELVRRAFGEDPHSAERAHAIIDGKDPDVTDTSVPAEPTPEETPEAPPAEPTEPTPEETA